MTAPTRFRPALRVLKGAGPRRTATVTHFGDRADGGGGIAAVIRQHLRSSTPARRAIAVATYDQSGSSAAARQRPALAALAVAARLPRRGSIAHVHLSRRGSLLREGLLLLLLRLRGVPVVVTLHGSTLGTMAGAPLAATRLLLRAADRVHGFDDGYRRRFAVPPHRWIALPNAVDLPPAVRTKRSPVVVFAGRVGRRKGADVLLAAWHDMPPGAELHLYGPVDRSSPLEEDVPLDGTAGVTVHGAVAPEAVLAALAEASVLVQPSRAEAFPMAVCEAMAAGCAVVGTDVGGLGELLRSAGQRVVPLDSESVRAALLALLETPEDAAALGRRALAFAAEHLAADVVARSWAAQYDDLEHAGARP